MRILSKLTWNVLFAVLLCASVIASDYIATILFDISHLNLSMNYNYFFACFAFILSFTSKRIINIILISLLCISGTEFLHHILFNQSLDFHLLDQELFGLLKIICSGELKIKELIRLCIILFPYSIVFWFNHQCTNHKYSFAYAGIILSILILGLFLLFYKAGSIKITSICKDQHSCAALVSYLKYFSFKVSA